MRILTGPCSYKVPDGGKALHLLELNHDLFFTTKLSRPPRCRLQGSRGGVCTVYIFMMNVLINLLEDIRLGLIIICCFLACDQSLEQGKQKICALQPSSLYVISCVFYLVCMLFSFPEPGFSIHGCYLICKYFLRGVQ